MTGSLQVYSVTEAEQAVAVEKKLAEPGLLDGLFRRCIALFWHPAGAFALCPSGEVQ